MRARKRVAAVVLTAAGLSLIGGPASAASLDDLDRLEEQVRAAADAVERTDGVLAERREEAAEKVLSEERAVGVYDDARRDLADLDEALERVTDRIDSLEVVLGVEADRLATGERILRGIALIPSATLDRARGGSGVSPETVESYRAELAEAQQTRQELTEEIGEQASATADARTRAEDVRAEARAAAEERDRLEVRRAELKRALDAARAEREDLRVALNGLDTIPVEWRQHPVPDWAARLPARGRDWAPSIDAAAREAGIDPILFAAIIWQESQFDPRARSHVGAYGFTQLMPATAADLGVDRADPVANLRGGARYVRQQLDQFGGDTTLALAAYNAGSGNVRKYGGVPPFPETRNYVIKIAQFRAELAG